MRGHSETSWRHRALVVGVVVLLHAGLLVGLWRLATRQADAQPAPVALEVLLIPPPDRRPVTQRQPPRIIRQHQPDRGTRPRPVVVRTDERPQPELAAPPHEVRLPPADEAPVAERPRLGELAAPLPSDPAPVARLEVARAAVPVEEPTPATARALEMPPLPVAHATASSPDRRGETSADMRAPAPLPLPAPAIAWPLGSPVRAELPSGLRASIGSGAARAGGGRDGDGAGEHGGAAGIRPTPAAGTGGATDGGGAGGASRIPTPPAGRPDGAVDGAGIAAPSPRPAGGGESTGGKGRSGRVGAGVLRDTEPIYPRAARRDGVEGTSVLRVSLDATGRVTAVEVATSSGDQRLDDAAVRAVRAWKFNPATEDNKPVASSMRVRVQFRLD
jgi:protein TonB